MADIDVEDVLSKLSQRDKISLLAGRYIDASLGENLLTRNQVSTSGTLKQSTNTVFHR
jgi:hypothetical protein